LRGSQQITRHQVTRSSHLCGWYLEYSTWAMQDLVACWCFTHHFLNNFKYIFIGRDNKNSYFYIAPILAKLLCIIRRLNYIFNIDKIILIFRLIVLILDLVNWISNFILDNNKKLDSRNEFHAIILINDKYIKYY
jgi:hypothetical protein